ncbi:MAG TPA: RlmE family RNA methyltransferase [Casimicrobiaceae bacterium]|nr:RlmE family RNA methyltransferase [Casimicrobiaceae bacterium]
MPSPLNPSKKKHRSNKAWLHEHVNDPYVKEAQRRGYRSRAAFKLLELDERDKLMRPGIAAVDLGAAPGSWSQVLHERLGPKGRVVGVDLLPMHPLRGVEVIQADFATDAGLAAVESALGGRPVDLVVSDMAPNLSGIDAVDQARSVGLAELALAFAEQHLQPGGDFAVKVFQGSGLAPLEKAVRERFAKAYVRKPKASRDRSREVFLVGKGYKGAASRASSPGSARGVG